ncbi:MAG: xanthine dehydrogenase family protein molybdopterin-binding subunit [Acidimicrobiia bacterium]
MVTKHIGRPVTRLEDDRLLRGLGEFVSDVRLPGMAEVAFVRSPFAHARIVNIDVSMALEVEGVLSVLTGETLPPHHPLTDTVTIEGLTKTPQEPLAQERVRYVGEPIAIIVAEDRYVAEDACSLVIVDYDELPTITGVAEAAQGSTLLFPDLGSNVVYSHTKTFGNPGRYFSNGTRIHRHVFRGNRVSASPLETRGCIAHFDRGRASLRFWSSTQSQHLLRRRLATTTGLAENRIRVTVPDVGGGFGQKIPASPEEVAVALASIAVNRPIRWIEDRRENLISAPHAKQQTIVTEMVVGSEGEFLAMRSDVAGDSGAYSFNTASALIEPFLSALLMPSVYRIEHYECTVTAALTNKSPISPYRGVGWTASHTARELLIDQIARSLGRDPADLRRQNMITSGQLPYESTTGMVYDTGSFVESLDLALELIEYRTIRESQQRTSVPTERRVGVGISPYVEPGGWGTGGAAESHWSFSSYDAVSVTMEPSGRVTLAVGTPTQGQGHRTSLAQIAAEGLGVRLEDVEVVDNDTATTPVSMAGTRASRTAVVSGGATMLAASDLRERIEAVAGYLLDAPEDELVVRDGTVFVKDNPARLVTMEEVAGAAYFDPGVRGIVPEPDFTVRRFYDPGATYSNGCITCAVELDTTTGLIRIIDLAAVEDCGTIINPMIVGGQVRGAAAQGIGYALLEQINYDLEGQIRTSTFADYLLPTADDVPRVKVRHIESPSRNTVGGIKGMGESGMIAVPAAVANAVADVLPPGSAIEHLPLDPEYVLDLLHGNPHESIESEDAS